MLTSVIIPDSVIDIGERAFFCCSTLIDIDVDKNNEMYKSIDGNLYSKDGKTLIQYAIGKTATSFVLPDGVTGIGEWALDSCESLESITMPDSVTSIGDHAFELCRSLTDINFTSTKAQWEAIEKVWGWDVGTGNYVIHCTDGDISKADS